MARGSGGTAFKSRTPKKPGTGSGNVTDRRARVFQNRQSVQKHFRKGAGAKR